MIQMIHEFWIYLSLLHEESNKVDVEAIEWSGFWRHCTEDDDGINGCDCTCCCCWEGLISTPYMGVPSAFLTTHGTASKFIFAEGLRNDWTQNVRYYDSVACYNETVEKQHIKIWALRKNIVKIRKHGILRNLGSEMSHFT